MPIALQDHDASIVVLDSELVPDGDPGTSYTLRPLSREVYKATIQKHTKTVPNRQTRSMEKVTDWAAVSEDLLDEAVASWSGILWRGEPAPCDRAMKMALDMTRAAALLDRAGLGQVQAGEADRQASFR